MRRRSLQAQYPRASALRWRLGDNRENAMRFRVPGEPFEFQIADADWSFAGMDKFQPVAPFFMYPWGLHAPEVDIQIVPLTDLEPCATRLERNAPLARERIVAALEKLKHRE